ncbi:MAG: ATP-binding cassette domain-containing protein [Steroidobacteraceae bacterium]
MNPATDIALEARHLTVLAAGRIVLRDVCLTMHRHEVFGIIGPSGAGKSTLLRALNRLLDLNADYRVHGDVLLAGKTIYASDTDVDDLRAHIGMVFQQPVVFPVSIFRNVIFGVRHQHSVRRSEWPEIVERSLREAALWHEVKDRLHASALKLSLGQQQRLCVARTLAMNPEIILMDEPTSALDAASTRAIEELVLTLKATRSIVLVTHNLAQARRVVDTLACIAVNDGVGEIAASGCCSSILTSVKEEEVRIAADNLIARPLKASIAAS